MRGRIVRGGEGRQRALRYGRGVASELVNSSIGASAVDVHVNRLRAGAAHGPYHLHTASENVYFLLAGRLTVRLDGQDHELEPGDAAFIPPGAPHSATNLGDEEAVLIEIYAPPGADFVEVAEVGQQLKGEA